MLDGSYAWGHGLPRMACYPINILLSAARGEKATFLPPSSIVPCSNYGVTESRRVGAL